MRRVYLAGRVTAINRLREIRSELRPLGFDVVSTWLDVAQQYPAALAQAGESQRDLQEIREASLFMLDTLDESPTGGREFEAGYAHALGIPIWRIGPARHIFHDQAIVVFNSWETFFNVRG